MTLQNARYNDEDDGDNIVDGTESVGDYVEPREIDSQFAEDARSGDHCCVVVDFTDHCFHWKGRDEVGQGNKFYTHSKQMAMYSDQITRSYWPSKESHYVLRNMEFSRYRLKF